jgi:hypothetical protein
VQKYDRLTPFSEGLVEGSWRRLVSGSGLFSYGSCAAGGSARSLLRSSRGCPGGLQASRPSLKPGGAARRALLDASRGHPGGGRLARMGARRSGQRFGHGRTVWQASRSRRLSSEAPRAERPPARPLGSPTERDVGRLGGEVRTPPQRDPSSACSGLGHAGSSVLRTSRALALAPCLCCREGGGAGAYRPPRSGEDKWQKSDSRPRR